MDKHTFTYVLHKNLYNLQNMLRTVNYISPTTNIKICDELYGAPLPYRCYKLLDRRHSVEVFSQLWTRLANLAELCANSVLLKLLPYHTRSTKLAAYCSLLRDIHTKHQLHVRPTLDMPKLWSVRYVSQFSFVAHEVYSATYKKTFHFVSRHLFGG
jgi:hypothetical protein